MWARAVLRRLKDQHREPAHGAERWDGPIGTRLTCQSAPLLPSHVGWFAQQKASAPPHSQARHPLGSFRCFEVCGQPEGKPPPFTQWGPSRVTGSTGFLLGEPTYVGGEYLILSNRWPKVDGATFSCQKQFICNWQAFVVTVEWSRN